MSNEPPSQVNDPRNSAPQGAEVISPPDHRPDVLEPEILERIEQLAHTTAVLTVKSELHFGPMPAPKTLGEYDAVLPGTSLIIREEFQQNGAHVRKLEDRGQAAMIARDNLNRKVAERLVWGSLGLILILAVLGHDSAAIAVAVTTVVAVITGFLRQKSSSDKKSPPEPEEDD